MTTEEQCRKILARWPDKVLLYKQGKSVMGFLVGQVIKETNGVEDSQLVYEAMLMCLREEHEAH